MENEESIDTYLENKILNLIDKKSNVFTGIKIYSSEMDSEVLIKLKNRSELIKYNFLEIYRYDINSYYVDCVRDYKICSIIDIKMEIYIETLLNEVLNDKMFSMFRRKVIINNLK